VEANDAFSASGFHLPDEDKKAFVCSRRTDLQLTAAMGGGDVDQRAGSRFSTWARNRPVMAMRICRRHFSAGKGEKGVRDNY
jgi:hypothetical protein